MDKPEHLRPLETAPMAWLAQRPAGVIAAALGVLSFIIVVLSQHELWSTPDWRISVPCFAATSIASAASILRHERGAYPMWALGLGLAAASVVLGWFLMLAIVIGATVVLMLILHALM